MPDRPYVRIAIVSTLPFAAISGADAHRAHD
jgi:hypothetical protein